MARGIDINIGGVEVRFASAEDLIIHKIIAGRPVDIENVKPVILKNPKLDHDYIDHWLEQFEQMFVQPFREAYAALRRDCED